MSGHGENVQVNPKTGLPVLMEEEKEKSMKDYKLKAFVGPIVTPLIGTGIAFLIYRFGSKDSYDVKIQAAGEFDAQWLILALMIFSFVVTWLNMYPVRFKDQFMGGYSAGNLRTNLHIYQYATMSAD